MTATLIAPSRETALKMLEKDGSLIVSIRKITNKSKWWEWTSPLNQEDILLITKRAGDMVSHGFTIVDAFKTIELQTNNKRLKDVVQDLKKQIEIGVREYVYVRRFNIYVCDFQLLK